MSSLIKLAKDEFLRKPCHTRYVKAEALLATPKPVWLLDLYKTRKEHLEHQRLPFDFAIEKKGSETWKQSPRAAFFFWFTPIFP
mmetsp:Transcript_6177/g.11325  ORF Transcript_6177/g.11325 Transcript_6177/m.11325 type:complete len:84 (-) Transcript_6177:414-665(-)